MGKLSELILSADQIQLNAALEEEQRNANNVWMSCFKAPISNCKPVSYRFSLPQVYAMVMMLDYYGRLTTELRAIDDPDRQREFKHDCLDFVTPSGVFSYRDEAHLVRHSGLIAVDIDEHENPEAVRDIDALKQHLLDDDDLIIDLMFRSPRGNGLKAFVRINVVEFSHYDNFRALRVHFLKKHGIVIDPSCRDICRSCFLCHDPQCFVSQQVSPF